MESKEASQRMTHAGQAATTLKASPLRKLDRVGASMYLSEIRGLVETLLFRIARLHEAREIWLAHHAIAQLEIRSHEDDFSPQVFNGALQVTSTQQSAVFDELEALLAAWARLSLFVHPEPGKKQEKERGQWREARGRILREVLALSDNSMLANREFRNAWMHFDERLDQAFLGGWLGNLQIFVRSAEAAAAVEYSVRVIDVEDLSFHYRSRRGIKECLRIDDMQTLLLRLQERLRAVGHVVAALPADPRSEQDD